VDIAQSQLEELGQLRQLRQLRIGSVGTLGAVGDIARGSGVDARGRAEGRTMWDLVRRVEAMGGAGEAEELQARPRESVGFAAKVIGIGVFAGLMLTYCNALIDACFRGLH
jgi:hypothetical protein